MQIELRFRRRAAVGESLAALNAKLAKDLARVPGLFANVDCVEGIEYDAGRGESAAANFTPVTVKGIELYASYASRIPAALIDKALSDDVLTARCQTNLVDYSWLANTLFPKLVECFLPYRASVVTDLDKDLDDFEEICREAQLSGKDVDGRDSVFRLHSGNYFDQEMCRRGLGVSASAAAEILFGHVPRSEVFCGGILIIASSQPLIGSAIDLANERIRGAIAANHSLQARRP